MKVHSPGNTSTPRADLEWSRGDDGVVCGKGSKGEIDWPVGRGEAKIHYTIVAQKTGEGDAYPF